MVTETILEAKGLIKSFKGKNVVNNLNLKVMRGDVYGFLGRNGQGKTTTIRMITGLISPDSGNVTIDGFNIKTDFIKAISHIGAIVESPTFYDYLSGYDNLKLMANLIPGILKSRIDEVLEIVGLKNRSKDKVKTYSLGMKQRLGLANALLNNPKLIILDEPTNGLDPQGIKEIRDMITRLSTENKITFFISSHLLHEVQQICNRIGIIHDGRLLYEGYVHEINNSSNGNSIEKLYFDITDNEAQL